MCTGAGIRQQNHRHAFFSLGSGLSAEGWFNKHPKDHMENRHKTCYGTWHAFIMWPTPTSTCSDTHNKFYINNPITHSWMPFKHLLSICRRWVTCWYSHRFWFYKIFKVQKFWNLKSITKDITVFISCSMETFLIWELSYSTRFTQHNLLFLLCSTRSPNRMLPLAFTSYFYSSQCNLSYIFWLKFTQYFAPLLSRVLSHGVHAGEVLLLPHQVSDGPLTLSLSIRMGPVGSSELLSNAST